MDFLWGSLKDGKWNGMVGDLHNGWADVVVTSLDNSASRAQVVDFLIGLQTIG